MLSDDIFGVDAPIRARSSYEDVKVGDLIEHKNNGETFHWSIVNKVGTAPSGSVYVLITEGGPTGEIKWTARYYIKNFDDEVVWTRYPD